MRFLLDTDTVSYALRGHGDVGRRLLSHKPSELAISAVTLAELRFGADRKKSRKLHDLIDAFVAPISVQPFDDSAAAYYGRLGSLLFERGTPMGDIDAMIAAHAIALKCTLITNNLRHFARVPGLVVESWA